MRATSYTEEKKWRITKAIHFNFLEMNLEEGEIVESDGEQNGEHPGRVRMKRRRSSSSSDEYRGHYDEPDFYQSRQPGNCDIRGAQSRMPIFNDLGGTASTLNGRKHVQRRQ